MKQRTPLTFILLVATATLVAAEVPNISKYTTQVFGCSSGGLYSELGTINVPVLAEGGRANVTVFLKGIDSLLICIKQNVPADPQTKDWATTCDYYGVADINGTVAARNAIDPDPYHPTEVAIVLPQGYFRSGIYYVSAYINDSINFVGEEVAFSVTLDASQCSAGFVGAFCSAPAAAIVPGATTTFTINGGDFQYFWIKLPQYIPGMEVALIVQNQSNPKSLLLYSRYRNIPVVKGQFNSSSNINDGSDTSFSNILRISSGLPSAGTWYFAVQNVQPAGNIVTFTFNTTISASCINTTFGCPTAMDLTNHTDGKIVTSTVHPNDIDYYSLTVTNRTTIRISVTATDGTVAPSVYVRFGNLPTSAEYDEKNCNIATANCSSVDVIEIYRPQVGDWFIGVTAATNVQYAIWLQSVCPGDCNGAHGNCDVTFATCNCVSDYGGLDCSEEPPIAEFLVYCSVIGIYFVGLFVVIASLYICP